MNNSFENDVRKKHSYQFKTASSFGFNLVIEIKIINLNEFIDKDVAKEISLNFLIHSTNRTITKCELLSQEASQSLNPLTNHRKVFLNN